MTFIFNAGLQAGLFTIEQLIFELKQAGYDGLEIFNKHLAADRGGMRRYKRAMENDGMRLACLDILCDLADPDPGVRRKSSAAIRAGIDLAREFGCDQCLLAGSSLKPGRDAAKGREMIADGIASHLDFARQAGVALLIENFGMSPELQCRADDCLTVIARARGNQVRFAFDTGNFLFAGENALVNLPKFSGLIHHVHVKSWRRLADRRPEDGGVFRDYIGCPVGEGVIPNRELIAQILSGGYKRWLSVECGAASDPLAAATRDCATVRKWIAETPGHRRDGRTRQS